MTNETLERPVVDRLDPQEQHFRIPSSRTGLSLFLRYLPPARDASREDRVVLYVHGGTFPSGLSIAHRFDSRSWRDELCGAGFHVWALDFRPPARKASGIAACASSATTACSTGAKRRNTTARWRARNARQRSDRH